MSTNAGNTFNLRTEVLPREDGVLCSVISPSATFDKVVSQNWFIPRLTDTICSGALLLMTWLTQLNYCELLWTNKQPLTFCWIWACGVLFWNVMAGWCTYDDIVDDRESGDFQFQNHATTHNAATKSATRSEGAEGHNKCSECLDSVRALWRAYCNHVKLVLDVARANKMMTLCLFVLNLLNVGKDVKRVTTLIHPCGTMTRTYGADMLTDVGGFKLQARHRYVILQYEKQALHDFEDTARAVVHWPLHIISVALFVIHLQDFHDSQHLSFTALSSLVMTSVSLFLKVFGVGKYMGARSAYMEHYTSIIQHGTALERTDAEKHLKEKFWTHNVSARCRDCCPTRSSAQPDTSSPIRASLMHANHMNRLET